MSSLGIYLIMSILRLDGNMNIMGAHFWKFDVIELMGSKMNQGVMKSFTSASRVTKFDIIKENLGLCVYGDGIECAAESFPAAPSIASLGRGIQNLQQVSQSIGNSCGKKIQKAIESLMYRFKNVKIQ